MEDNDVRYTEEEYKLVMDIMDKTTGPVSEFDVASIAREQSRVSRFHESKVEAILNDAIRRGQITTIEPIKGAVYFKKIIGGIAVR